jgi:acetylornithine deacetylase/succinyl-diaminopimelate desuccinylase-like protein
MKSALRAVLVFVIIFSAFTPALTTPEQEPDWSKTGDEAVRLVAEFLRVDTTNPPGNETRAAAFFAAILDKEGIEYKISESSPGRGNLYARMKGNGRKRPLILLNHTDVVPSDKRFWKIDPLSGEIRDGYIYGRGAIDMKGMGAVQFMTFLLLKRSAVPLDRDVIFLATADEEAGGLAGAGWFVKNNAELIRDAEFLITEGSSNHVVGNRRVYYGVGGTEKTPCWLKLTARGVPGHGSVPRSDSAPSRLLRALGKLEKYETELKVVPAVARYFRAIADYHANPDLKRAYSDVAAAIKDSRLRKLILSNPHNAALLRNTIQPTVVNIGSKTNVIEPVATAEIDCRLLPGERPEDFIAQIKNVIDDPLIEVETLLAFPATESSLDTELYKTITEVIRVDDPEAAFVPTVLAGFTDSHYFRELGIVSYGFSPFLIESTDYSGVHGNDERISIPAVRDGTKLLYRIVRGLCGSKP